MINPIVNIKGVKVKGKILVSRKDVCDLLDIKSDTLSSKLSKYPRLRDAQIKSAAGEMWDIEKLLSIKLPKNDN